MTISDVFANHFQTFCHYPDAVAGAIAATIQKKNT